MASMSSDVPLGYDETAIEKRLATLSVESRGRFACSCAERLIPLGEWAFTRTGRAGFDLIRSALDAAWEGERLGDARLHVLRRHRTEVEALIPDEDDDEWQPELPYVTNAVTAVAYALSTWESTGTEDALWAARQLHEAIDYSIQVDAPEDEYVDVAGGHPAMRLALAAIWVALSAANEQAVPELRRAAHADGVSLLTLVTGAG